MKRRKAIKNIGLGIGSVTVAGSLVTACSETSESAESKESQSKITSKVNHSACRWCYRDIPLEEFAREGKKIGLKAIDLLKPDEWSIVNKEGLECSLATDVFADIQNGFNDVSNHTHLQSKYTGLINSAADAGVKRVIVFSGNRNGISDEVGIENCALGLDPLVKLAEKRNVTLVMELLNSKVDHADYQCDHTPWGVGLAEKIGSDRFKLLYDIYHMQIMEGDVIATIKKYHKYIDHYHTGGVPGRNEINKSQELYYPAIIKAIVDTGFDGYIAQEFIPTYPNKLEALKEAVSICNV